jgi:cytochrome d ubiquinol oxidase subunit I
LAEVIFNPSFSFRLAHMTMAAYLATALFVGASCAWHLLRGHRVPAVRTMLSMAMWMVLAAAPLQIAIGDVHGLNTLKHQPAKIAAMEGHWRNEPGQGVPLILFGWPDMEAQTTLYALEVPRLGSLILTHSFDGQFRGLSEFPAQDRPNATIVFLDVPVDGGAGIPDPAARLCAAWLRWRERLYASRLFLRVATLMGPAGLIAILAGWYTTEIGRQPWVVYGLMRTEHAVSDHPALAVSTTLALFIVMYIAVFGTGISYMLKLVAKGPTEGEDTPGRDHGPSQRPARPLSAAPGHLDPAIV